MIPREPILTERLRLEPVGPEHAEQIWNAAEASLDELRPWLPWARAASPEASRDFAERSETAWVADTDYAFTVMEEGEVVGGVGLHTPRLEGLGEIGYWSRTDRTRRGYTTEACNALLAFAFQTVGLYRVELRAGVENRASQRVAEKLGFRLEGTLRQGCPSGEGGGYDCLLYGLLASDGPSSP
ncbi:MAG: GNAT family N-acetyltransferase [Actinomycetota bacterium]